MTYPSFFHNPTMSGFNLTGRQKPRERPQPVRLLGKFGVLRRVGCYGSLWAICSPRSSWTLNTMTAYQFVLLEPDFASYSSFMYRPLSALHCCHVIELDLSPA